ncbi:MAG: hypothetical protein E4G96_04670 [Chrysiogenales bacterium]|nr:MAG: hypothetical protein E4G96_04670 [Chrysiogenales bacterium]
MSKSMRTLRAVAALLIVSLAALPGRGEEAGTIRMVLGVVTIESGGASRAAAVNDRLAGGETIVTGPNSMADVLMGERGYIRIREKSRVKIASLKKEAQESDLELSMGGVMIFLPKLARKGAYEVKSPTQVAAVRGTIFQMSGEDDGSRVDVLSGTVAVNPVADGEVKRDFTQLVSENQSLMLNRAIVLQILLGKKKFKIETMRRDIKENFRKQVEQIRQLPDFQRFSDDMKKEVNDRVLRIKEEMKEKQLDRESLKERMKQEKERLKQERGRMKEQFEKMRDKEE